MADDDCEIQAKAEPTGIDNANANANAKYLCDGMLLIVRDGKLFNLIGAQVR